MLSSGEVFAGRYRVLERIAQGGMGVIYAAEHISTEERVALKVLWPHVLGSKAAVESFQLEARVGSRIGSEHVVRVQDAGLDAASGLPFLAMELLRGATLRTLVSKLGPLSPRQTTVLVCQVAKALDKAHGHVGREGRPAPIVHRDLKPENVFVSLREGVAVVKVLDFGIAKVLSENTEQSQEVRGTPLFMAYEQFTKGPITPRLDVWALGLIVFYLLTGRKYWLAQGGGDFAPLLGEILTLPLVTPSARARAFGLEPQWRPDFDDWFLQCVNRNLDARFGSAGAAATALESALRGARLPRADVTAALSELARRVAGLVGPSPAGPPGDEATYESAGPPTEESALDVASAEVHSYMPSGRAVVGSWADAPTSEPGASRPTPPEVERLTSPLEVGRPAPRLGVEGPASRPEVRGPLPSFADLSQSGIAAPARPLAVTTLGVAPPASVFEQLAAKGVMVGRGPLPSAGAAVESVLSATASTRTLRLGTVASDVTREPGSPLFYGAKVWALAASVAVGCAASFAAVSLVGGRSSGGVGAVSAGALLSAPPSAIATPAAAPSPPPVKTIAAEPGSAEPEPPPAASTAGVPASRRTPDDAEKRTKADDPKKPLLSDLSPQRLADPLPERRPQKPGVKPAQDASTASSSEPPRAEPPPKTLYERR